jgi:hypothetical protein
MLPGRVLPPDRLTLTGYLGADQWEPITERVSEGERLSIYVDEMVLTASPQGISGTFLGQFALYAGGTSYVLASCWSQNHGAVLTR